MADQEKALIHLQSERSFPKSLIVFPSIFTVNICSCWGSGTTHSRTIKHSIKYLCENSCRRLQRAHQIDQANFKPIMERGVQIVSCPHLCSKTDIVLIYIHQHGLSVVCTATSSQARTTYITATGTGLRRDGNTSSFGTGKGRKR